MAPRPLQKGISFRAPEGIPPARSLAEACAMPGKPPGPQGPGLRGGTSVQNRVWSLSPPGQSSWEGLLWSTAPCFPPLCPFLRPLFPSSWLLFQLFPLPTSKFSPLPAFLPDFAVQAHCSHLSLLELSTTHRCFYYSDSGSPGIEQPSSLPSPTLPRPTGLGGGGEGAGVMENPCGSQGQCL